LKLERVKIATPEGQAIDQQYTSSLGQQPTSSAITHVAEEAFLNEGGIGNMIIGGHYGYETTFMVGNFNTYKTKAHIKSHDGVEVSNPLTEQVSSINIRIPVTASSIYNYSSSLFGDNGDSGLFLVDQLAFQTMITASREDMKPSYEREFFYKAGNSGSITFDVAGSSSFGHFTRHRMEATDQNLREKKSIGLFKPKRYHYSSSMNYSTYNFQDLIRRKKQRFTGTGQLSGLSTHITSSGSGSIWYVRDNSGNPNSGQTYTSSFDTPDGLPVIEVFNVNPNVIVVTGPTGLETVEPVIINPPKTIPVVKVVPVVQPEVIPTPPNKGPYIPKKVVKYTPKVVPPKVTKVKKLVSKSKYLKVKTKISKKVVKMKLTPMVSKKVVKAKLTPKTSPIITKKVVKATIPNVFKSVSKISKAKFGGGGKGKGGKY
jgi:hypothetical protein